MIYIKTPEEIKIMREGGKILADILKKIAGAIKPGVKTEELDRLARELISFYKVKAAFLGYGGFPATICTCINDVVVHGVPSSRTLEKGDIISLDMGIIHRGFNLDSAITVPVLDKNLSYEKWSASNPQPHKLLEITRGALNAGINQARAGNRLGEVSHTIQTIIEGESFGVVRELVGHGIGKSLHEEPQIPNFGEKDEGPKLKEGMVLAIEPMVTAGDWRLVKDADGFSYRTRDGSLAAHFEHTVAITSASPLVLTK